MGQFTKGNKLGVGWKEGQAASTRDLRNMLRNLAVEEFTRFVEELRKQKGKAYTDTMNQVYNYVIPKLSSVKVDDNGKAATMMDLINEVAQYHREERDNKKATK